MPQASAHKYSVPDADRFDNSRLIETIVHEHAKSGPTGIFAGNDETAMAALMAIEREQCGNIVVVGCDSTREMHKLLDSRTNPHALATIDTRSDIQARRILDAMHSKRNYYQEPELYPIGLRLRFQAALGNPELRALWDGSR